MIDRLPAHALRPFDAIRLLVACELRVHEVATADRIIAAAASELGLHFGSLSTEIVAVDSGARERYCTADIVAGLLSWLPAPSS